MSTSRMISRLRGLIADTHAIADALEERANECTRRADYRDLMATAARVRARVYGLTIQLRQAETNRLETARAA